MPSEVRTKNHCPPGCILAYSGCRDLERRFGEIQFSPCGARVWGDKSPGTYLFQLFPTSLQTMFPKIKAQFSHSCLHWGGAGTLTLWGSLSKAQLSYTQPSLPCFRRSGLLPFPRRFGGDKLQPQGSARSLDRADASCSTVNKEADNVTCAPRL